MRYTEYIIEKKIYEVHEAKAKAVQYDRLRIYCKTVVSD